MSLGWQEQLLGEKKMQSKKKSKVHFTLDIMQIPKNSSVLKTFPLDYLLILLGIDHCCSLLELLKVRTWTQGIKDK